MRKAVEPKEEDMDVTQSPQPEPTEPQKGLLHTSLIKQNGKLNSVAQQSLRNKDTAYQVCFFST